jgi:nucleotide-binding universal stress UspA family protein
MAGSDRSRETVLVGVDGSQPALRAVRWAAAEARRRHAALRVINAFGWLPTDRSGVVIHAEHSEVMVQAARELVATAVAQALHVAPDVAVTGEVLTEFPIPRLVTESRHAQLVVVGDRGRGGVADMLVGSVAVAVAAHAACPVVVARGAEPVDATAAARPVVVGVGAPPETDAVVRFAFEEAALRDAPLVAVHAWRYPASMDPDAAALVDWDAVAADEDSALAEDVARWGEKFPGVPVKQVLLRGGPARELVEQSRDAQLVVVGTRGHGSVPGMFLGSVSHALLHHASCPVAVVRCDPVGGPR